MSEQRVLIVDDEEGLRHSLSVHLKKAGFAPTTAAGAEEALAVLAQESFDVILCDIRMPGMDGLALLAAVQERGIESTVLMMSAYGDNDTAIAALRAGAYDYIAKPFKKDEVILAIRKAEERETLRRENRLLRATVEREYRFENLVSRNATMQGVFDAIRRIAGYKTTVLITGESGTGKELVARAIHFNGRRKERPVVAVNCGAIPEPLLESELFGHVRGAFTDAHADKRGLIEEADGGTLFLDEVGELPLALQVKLLRVLQDGMVRKVGGVRSIQVDVRVIAATVRNLEEDIRTGRFREDLYYRLNVFPICLPALRERPEDVPLLVEHFVPRLNAKLGTSLRGATKEALALLAKYPWPGNVREVENSLERAAVLCSGEWIAPEHLPEKVREAGSTAMPLDSGDLSIKRNARLLEERMIRQALTRTGGNRTQAARILDISHRALLYKIQEYKIDL
jgi:two-component system response regulator AtoC